MGLIPFSSQQKSNEVGSDTSVSSPIQASPAEPPLGTSNPESVPASNFPSNQNELSLYARRNSAQEHIPNSLKRRFSESNPEDGANMDLDSPHFKAGDSEPYPHWVPVVRRFSIGSAGSYNSSPRIGDWQMDYYSPRF